MRHLFLDTHGGRLALYMNGDLQFDRDDERLYHEPLGLMPVALAARRAAGRSLRVLVLGGGDGLALREILRFPAVREAHVVDRDAAVLDLARTRLADLNGHALVDPRTRVHVADARDVLHAARDYDAIVADLTYPRELADAPVFTVEFFEHVRRALAPGGVLAINAVSPERTPEAFGCIAATLVAAGLASVPYSVVLPSFLAEGYGRWGFLFASAEPITDDELLDPGLPPGVALSGAGVLSSTELPETAIERMSVSPNVRDELLYYIANATPVTWAAPFRRFRFGEARGTRSFAEAGPRLTAAQGFAAWLRQPAGQRSLETLLGCLPLAQQRQTRDLVLEWSEHADSLLRGVDVRAFVDRLTTRATSLPEAWRRELAELADRVRERIPSPRELLEGAWRVFAVFLLVMLVANLMFPDNLYAKGSTSGSSRGTGGGSSPTVHFSNPSHTTPYRNFYRGPTMRSRVYGPTGHSDPTEPFVFADPQSGQRSVSSLLALSPELRLLEFGLLSYTVPIPGYQFLLHPDRLAVMDPAGRDVLSLHPGSALVGQASALLAAQGPLLDKALADHRRWLDWTRWAAPFEPVRDASGELEQLEQIRTTVSSARATWTASAGVPAISEDRNAGMIFPGVSFDRARKALVVVRADGTERVHALTPPSALTDEDRFLFWVLYYRVTSKGDQRFRTTVESWRDAHGAGLGGGG